MTFAEEFDQLGLELYRLDLLQTDIVYRKSDGQPSMAVKIKDGERVKQTKPIKSIHLFEFDADHKLRIKRSNGERKHHLEMALEEIKKFKEIHELLMTMKGVQQGKNIIWKIDHEKSDFESVKAYLTKVEQDKIHALEKPLVVDDLLLVAGWEV